MNETDTIVRLAQAIAAETSTFFEAQGPGLGNLETNAFMEELRCQVENTLGSDYAERKICGSSRLAVDFYIPNEATIVEVALGLRNPNSEFERDVLKAVMAQELGNHVERLVFVSKLGGVQRTSQAGARAMISWLRRNHGIEVQVHELVGCSRA